MALGLGPRVKVQFAREATWATPLTTNRCIAVHDVTFETKPQMAISANMPAANQVGGSGAQPWMEDSANSGIVIANELTDGQLTAYLDYEGLMQFFDMIYGTATYGAYGATVTGAGPFTHAFVEKEFLNSMCMEVFEGGVAVGKCALVSGVKIRKMTLSGKAVAGEGSLVKMTLDMVAQKKLVNQTPSASLNTTIARLPVRMADLTVTLDGTGDTIVLRSFDLTITPQMVDKQHQGGSTYIREPVRVGLIDTRLKITREYSSDSPVTTLLAGANLTPGLTFTNGAKSIAISMAAARLMTVSQPKATLTDVMTQDLELKAQWKDGSGGCPITFINTQAGAAA